MRIVDDRFDDNFVESIRCVILIRLLCVPLQTQRQLHVLELIAFGRLKVWAIFRPRTAVMMHSKSPNGDTGSPFRMMFRTHFEKVVP